jgi:hypothetical protein
VPATCPYSEPTPSSPHDPHQLSEENYFPYNGKYFKPTKGMAMGSPTSGTLAEIYLHFFEELIVKHGMENGEITYYRRYVDDIIVFDQNKIN